ncbi:MAG: DNA methyltransferase, partial [Terrimicrobiaceae bacterium]|nr:DNA methyltransferase [Terrimicrobiaceae bacterium]
MRPDDFLREMAAFRELGSRSQISNLGGVPVFVNEFWTSAQRAGHSLHEVSYRACFKPQLPAFFIERFTRPGELVFDPFMGRGTTLIEAALRGRAAGGCDANPVARVFTAPRLEPPPFSKIEERIARADLSHGRASRQDLEVFFHPETLREIEGWRAWFRSRREAGEFDRVDAWLEMVAANRLTGHSKGFFSVYTLPPNQAASIKAQQRINPRRNQRPEPRPTRPRILRKSRQLLADPLPPGYGQPAAAAFTASAHRLETIADGSAALVLTSPPFLDTVNYLDDNWLRMWFCGIEARREDVWMIGKLASWKLRMEMALGEIARILRPGGVAAFEVGEVRKGSLELETQILDAARSAGLEPLAILINSQEFTKTANCWGVDNNTK